MKINTFSLLTFLNVIKPRNLGRKCWKFDKVKDISTTGRKFELNLFMARKQKSQSFTERYELYHIIIKGSMRNCINCSMIWISFKKDGRLQSDDSLEKVYNFKIRVLKAHVNCALI